MNINVKKPPSALGRGWFVKVGKTLAYLFPVLPNPPLPRAVSESSAASSKSGYNVGSTTSWATFWPFSNTNSVSFKLYMHTINSPRYGASTRPAMALMPLLSTELLPQIMPEVPGGNSMAIPVCTWLTARGGRTDEPVKVGMRLAADGYLYITVTNPVSGAESKRELLSARTTKKDPLLHGYGTRIADEIVRRYNGAINRGVADGRYTADVMLDAAGCEKKEGGHAA